VPLSSLFIHYFCEFLVSAFCFPKPASAFGFAVIFSRCSQLAACIVHAAGPSYFSPRSEINVRNNSGVVSNIFHGLFYSGAVGQLVNIKGGCAGSGIECLVIVTWAMRPSSGLSKDTHNPTGLHFDFTCLSVQAPAWFRAAPRGPFPWCLNYIRPPKNAEGRRLRARLSSSEVTAVRPSVQHGQFLFAPRFEVHFISFASFHFSGLHVLGLERTLHDQSLFKWGM
jgi:hypothetical protein